MSAHQVLRLFMLSMSICMIFGVTMGSALPDPDSPVDSSILLDEPADEEPSTRLQQQAEDNASAIRRLAEVMKNMVTVTANQRCLGTGTSAQQLTDSIKEGFSVLVGAVQDLNSTMRHFQEDLRKTTGEAVTVFEDEGPCPSPFFLAGEDCLYIETETLRYFDAARQACIDMGAKLAEFDTFDHFISAVTAMDLHEDAEIYVGGTDREDEGTWKWLSGENMRRIPWGSGEPNNLFLEDCIALKPRWKKFNDIRCSLRREYVCKWQH